MLNYLGDYAEDSTIYVPFTTNDGNGGRVAFSATIETADFVIYKNNSATQKATVNGLTISETFDALVGVHLLVIDTSVDTGDAGFWATGSDYWVVLYPDETVDSQSISAVIGLFSIQNRYMRGTNNANTYSTIVLDTTVAVAGNAATFTLTAGKAATDAYKNALVMITDATDGNIEVRRIINWTSGRIVTVDRPFSFTPDVADVARILTGYDAGPSGGGRF